MEYVIVSEAGASVYSASKLASEEFPRFDVGQRSAASIARRLQDPLAELVKIDPRSIGVGQYQHDMNQKKLSDALSGVVEDCVNRVGRGSEHGLSAPLLAYISGISGAIAKNIVAYREENGRFTDRRQLLKVPKLGPKAFEQSAGFMRITGGDNPLDATAVHPETYQAAGELLSRQGFTPEDVAGGRLTRSVPHHPGLREAGRGAWHRRAYPAGHREGAGEAGTGSQGRDAKAHPAHGCAGDEGSEGGHGPEGDCQERH